MFKEIPVSQCHIETRRKEKVYGAGVNDAPYYTSLDVEGETHNCPFCTRWKKMLSSCYSIKNGSGVTKSVCNEWMSFMAFRGWMELQSWQGKELTHWLRMPGATIYSPATCLFVSKRVRSLFPAPTRRRTGRPFGVQATKGRFLVSCSSVGSKRGYVGSYNTLNEAIEAYISAKEAEAVNVACSQKDIMITKAVLDYSRYFSDQQRVFKTI